MAMTVLEGEVILKEKIQEFPGTGCVDVFFVEQADCLFVQGFIQTYV